MTSTTSNATQNESDLLEQRGQEAGFEWAQRCLVQDAEHPEVRAFARFEESTDAGRAISRQVEMDSSLSIELEAHGRYQLDLDGSDPWSDGFAEGVVAAWWCDLQ